jgi:hypothetical protein
MTTYRAYRVDKHRHIQSGAWLQARNDEDAAEQASELCDESTPVIELWQAARLVEEIACDNDTD